MAFVDFWKFKMVDINPFVVADLSDYESRYILSFGTQFILYIVILYALYVIYSVLRKVYLVEISFLYKIIVIALWINTIYSYLLIPYKIESALLGTLTLFLLKIQKDDLQEEYVEIKLLDLVNKHNIFRFVLFLLVIVLANLVYIILPKDSVFAYYEHEHRYEMYRYDVIEENVSAEKTYEINSSFFLFSGGRASEISALTSGEYAIVFSRIEEGIQEEFETTQVMVDENLKFHFDIELEYIMLFYPLNFFVIVWCLIYLFLVLLKKYINWMKK